MQNNKKLNNSDIMSTNNDSGKKYFFKDYQRSLMLNTSDFHHNNELNEIDLNPNEINQEINDDDGKKSYEKNYSRAIPSDNEIIINIPTTKVDHKKCSICSKSYNYQKLTRISMRQNCIALSKQIYIFTQEVDAKVFDPSCGYSSRIKKRIDKALEKDKSNNVIILLGKRYYGGCKLFYEEKIEFKEAPPFLVIENMLNRKIDIA
ncbi:unnamed protein product, partial [Brachionus calyciflorus]